MGQASAWSAVISSIPLDGALANVKAFIVPREMQKSSTALPS